MDATLLIVSGIALALAVGVIVLELRRQSLKRQIATLKAQPKPVTVQQPTAQELEAKLRAAYEAKITEASTNFGAELQATSSRLTDQVSRLTTSVIEEELEEYHKSLEQVRQTANESMEKIRAAVDEQRIELKTSMEAELAAERKRLADKFEAKLGDVVSSYIAESLGGGVDLGAQMQYVLSSLESHKAEIRKDLESGV